MKNLNKFILLVLLCLSCSGCFFDNKEKQEFDYHEYIVNESKMFVEVDYYNKETKDISIEVTYYDKNKKEMNRNHVTVKAVSNRSIFVDLGNVPKEYDTYDLDITYNKTDKKDLLNYINVVEHDTTQFITVDVTSLYDSDLSLNVGIAFYKGNNLIGYDNESFILKERDTYNAFIYYPSESINNIEFDNYVLYLNQVTDDIN